MVFRAAVTFLFLFVFASLVMFLLILSFCFVSMSSVRLFYPLHHQRHLKQEQQHSLTALCISCLVLSTLGTELEGVEEVIQEEKQQMIKDGILWFRRHLRYFVAERKRGRQREENEKDLFSNPYNMKTH